VGTALAATALLMGLAGGPHCAAMCGAACAGVVRASAPVRFRPARHSLWRQTLILQVGRVAGYALAGALAAGAAQGLAWLGGQAAALRPVWTLFHLALLGWGLSLLVLGRQPAWADGAGRALWARVHRVVRRPGGLLATGALWVFMPCGLLYSALLVAALSGGALDGALSMALFGAGSAAGIAAAPWLLARLGRMAGRVRQDWGTRLAGLALAASAAWGTAMDVGRRVAEWCA